MDFRVQLDANARESAERIVTALYAGTGYTVSFQWPGEQEHVGPESMNTLLSAVE
jgi:hypothetical protein